MGVTAKMWAHEYWYLSQCPDIITFAGASQSNGFFATLDYHLGEYGISVDPNLDLTKVSKFSATWNALQYYEYLELAQDTSTFLKIELQRVEKEKGFI
mmetsp:Transcript_23179/g.17605  ORF Transcript_23179/g.17605 Transcript_23179/m.17605 type:complete len:98 (-) Transcript_23179:265-558(-)